MTQHAEQSIGQPDDNKVQGEGDYEAGRRYDKAARDFASSGQVDKAARKAEPKTEEEARDMARAEDVGRSRSRGDDPATGR
jgi:hypothetical protein